MTDQAVKQSLRKYILALREQLSPAIHSAHSATITKHLLQLPEYQQANTILGYMNFGAEFTSELWIQQVLADGKKLALPRVNRHANHLDLYWVDDLENQLAAGLWGIREPIVERCKRLATLNEVEFALLPGVAFTQGGARLGYGGGFYDKLLDKIEHHPVLVAAAFGLQVVKDIPQEITDVKVEWVVTEQEIIDCSKS